MTTCNSSTKLDRWSDHFGKNTRDLKLLALLWISSDIFNYSEIVNLMDGKIWKNDKVFCEWMHVYEEICLDDNALNFFWQTMTKYINFLNKKCPLNYSNSHLKPILSFRLTGRKPVQSSNVRDSAGFGCFLVSGEET